MGKNHGKKNLLKGILIACVILLAVVAVQLGQGITGWSITGYVPVSGYRHEAYASLSQSQIFAIEPKGTNDITSFRISGKISGNGSVNIYLKNEKYQMLVYSNAKRMPRFGTVQITGMAAEKVFDVPFLIIRPGKSLPYYERSNQTIGEGIVLDECIETCIIPGGFFDGHVEMVILIEPGAVFELDEIGVSVIG